MDFDEYQKQASQTATFNKDDADYIRMYLSMGLAGESGEVVEKVKHVIRDVNGVLTDEKREEIKKEIGDVLWYLSQLSRVLGISFQEAAELNITKILDRQKRGVLKSEGDNR